MSGKGCWRTVFEGTLFRRECLSWRMVRLTSGIGDTHRAEMQPTLGFSALEASKAASEDMQFPTKTCLRLQGGGAVFLVTSRSCPLTFRRGLQSADESLDLSCSSGAALDVAWVLPHPTSLQYLLCRIASEILGWTWRIKWRNYEVDEKNTYVVAVID